jgi:hypothetical protein
MKYRRLVVAGLCAVALTTTVAGCGGSSGSPSESPTTTSEHDMSQMKPGESMPTSQHDMSQMKPGESMPSTTHDMSQMKPGETMPSSGY